MKTYTYLNRNNQVVYSDYKDSEINKNNKQLKRFVIDNEYYSIFVKYYQLRLHPEALKNITK
jgi:hypothetical protein